MTKTGDDNPGEGNRLSITAQKMLELRDVVLGEWEKKVLGAVDQAKELQRPILIDTFPRSIATLPKRFHPTIRVRPPHNPAPLPASTAERARA